jgi:hypothetical protein
MGIYFALFIKKGLNYRPFFYYLPIIVISRGVTWNHAIEKLVIHFHKDHIEVLASFELGCMKSMMHDHSNIQA